MLKKQLFGLAVICLTMCSVADAMADTIKDIKVNGLERVEASTVTAYMGIATGENLDSDKLNEGIKKLYATELFSDVSLKIDGDVVTIKVHENPVVNKVAFEGNDKFSESELNKEIQLKPRSVYTRTKVQQDVERILNLYRRGGRFRAKVEPKVITQSQNRVDVVFEINEGPVTKVKNIFFVGNKNYSESQLRSVVRTEITRWYKFFSSDDTYDPDRLEYDKEMLRKYYSEHGYADFQVKSAIAELAPEGDGFYITYTVDEGERYDFGKIALDVKLPDVKADSLQPKIKTVSGDIYNSAQVESSTEAMTTALGDLGYAFVDVDSKIERDVPNHKINVTYVANEAPRVYVERINITGNVRTADQVLRREFRLAEGDPFSVSKLKRSEQRLKNLGFFEKVNVTTTPGSTADRANINVAVTEKSTGELSLGGGFSTVDGPLADIGVKENNLLGEGKQLSAKLTLAAKRQEATVSYTEPYFLDREMAAGFDIFKTEQDLTSESSYNSASVGGTLRTSYALTENLNHSINYTLRKDTVLNVQSTASRFIIEQEGDYTTSSVGHALLYDTRDNKFDPSEGMFARFKQDAAGIGGDAKYLRNEIKAGMFYSVVPQWVLQFVASGGYISSFNGGVRINDRFFVGSRQIRGFNNAGIGPRDINTRDALGGNVYYVGSTELTFPLGNSSDTPIKGSIFVDAGSLWDCDSVGSEVRDSNSIRVSAGVGLAWASPLGPIRLDFGQAIVKESYDETELIRFTFGTSF